MSITTMSISTNKTLRKCEKKIKEIDELKQKDVNLLNNEETEKLKMEKYWNNQLDECIEDVRKYIHIKELQVLKDIKNKNNINKNTKKITKTDLVEEINRLEETNQKTPNYDHKNVLNQLWNTYKNEYKNDKKINNKKKSINKTEYDHINNNNMAKLSLLLNFPQSLLKNTSDPNFQKNHKI